MGDKKITSTQSTCDSAVSLQHELNRSDKKDTRTESSSQLPFPSYLLVPHLLVPSFSKKMGDKKMGEGNLVGEESAEGEAIAGDVDPLECGKVAVL